MPRLLASTGLFGQALASRWTFWFGLLAMAACAAGVAWPFFTGSGPDAGDVTGPAPRA
jgi:hypothetical protein